MVDRYPGSLILVYQGQVTLDELIDYLQRYRSVHPEQGCLPVHLDDRQPDFNRKGFEPELDEFARLEVGQVTNGTVSPPTYYNCLRLKNKGTIESLKYRDAKEPGIMPKDGIYESDRVKLGCCGEVVYDNNEDGWGRACNRPLPCPKHSNLNLPPNDL